jgi:hypothetical protein
MAPRPFRLAGMLLPVVLVIGLAAAAPVAAVETNLIAELSGDNEFPGPGDPDGGGFADLLIDPDTATFCYFVEVGGLDAATAAHVHEGAAGTAGPPVITLDAPGDEGFAEGCIDGVDATLLQAIVDDPAGYYVNVHTGAYPDGAVRGQLMVPPPQLFAELLGANEYPGPGDPDGVGSAFVSPDVANETLCWAYEFFEIGTVTAAHVHEGAAGVSGPPVVTLGLPAGDDPFAEGCADPVDPTLLEAILAAPESYYVNVHTDEYPDGAIRGQLSTEPPPPPPAEECTPPELCSGIAVPGTYVFGDFDTDLQFEVFEPMNADDLNELGFFIYPDPTKDTFGGLYLIPYQGEVWDPCFTEEIALPTDADGLTEWFTDHPWIDTTEPVETEFGGVPAWQFDALALEPEGCDEPPPWLPLFVMPTFGDFHFDFGEQDRVWIMDVGDQVLVAFAFVLPGGDFEGMLATLDPIVDSMEWQLGPAPTTPPVVPDTAVPTAVSPRTDAGVPIWASLAVLGVLLAAAASSAVARARAGG